MELADLDFDALDGLLRPPPPSSGDMLTPTPAQLPTIDYSDIEIEMDSSEDGSVPIAGEPSLQSVSRSFMGYDDPIPYGSNSRSLDADMVVDEIFSSDDERAPIAQSIAPIQFFRDDPMTPIYGSYSRSLDTKMVVQ